jgi:Phage tail tube protein
MPKIGRRQSVGYKKEAVRNTAETGASSIFIPLLDFSVEAKNEYMEDNSSFGNRGAMLGKEIASQMVGGSMSGMIDVDYIGYWLMHVLGSDPSPVTANGATTHNFALLQSEAVPSFTLQYDRADEGNLRLKGGAFSTFSLEFGDKDCKYNGEILGIAEETGNSQTPAYTKPTRYLLGKNVVSKFATTLAGLSSGTDFKIRNLKITFSTGAANDMALGLLNPYDIFSGEYGIELEFSGVVRATTFYSAFLANTKYALEFDANASNLPVLGTSALYPRFRLQTPPSVLEISHKQDMGDLVMFDAKVKVELPQLAAILLQNTIASY